jgi:hypothetical protein
MSLARTGLIAVGLLVATGPAMAGRVIGNCSPTQIKFVAADNSNSTSSGSFQVIPGMALKFVQGGNAPSCIIVEIQGTAFAAASTNQLVSLDALLDGNDDDDYITGSQPQFMEGNQKWSITNSHKFIWINVAPGPHNVKVYYRSANGGSVTLNQPTMIIHYVP